MMKPRKTCASDWMKMQTGRFLWTCNRLFPDQQALLVSEGRDIGFRSECVKIVGFDVRNSGCQIDRLAGMSFNKCPETTFG